jgi:hypothetical protein
MWLSRLRDSAVQITKQVISEGTEFTKDLVADEAVAVPNTQLEHGSSLSVHDLQSPHVRFVDRLVKRRSV